MSTSTQKRRPARAFSATDLLWFLMFLVLLIAILLPSLTRAREQAKRAVCASNLRGIGQSLHIYANDNTEWFPNHYFNPLPQAESPDEHGVAWVGTMGSNDFLRISQATGPDVSPRRSHPSRSLFMLIIGGQMPPGWFICPSTYDGEDDLRNYGPDADGAGSCAARPGMNRFDFRGYDSLSYGYQLPYGRKARLRESLDARMAIVADKSPYYTSGGSGMAGTRTARDARSDLDPPAEWNGMEASRIAELGFEQWRGYNSRNHGREGQNVLYVDGHVEFQRRPVVGVNGDNLYTIQSGHTTTDGMIGRVPPADRTLGPLTNTDSFLAP